MTSPRRGAGTAAVTHLALRNSAVGSRANWGALGRTYCTLLLSLLTLLNRSYPILPESDTMQAAADSIKSAVTGEKTSAEGLKEYQRGYKPEPKTEKELQGGEGSRPPGKQIVMKGEFSSPRRRAAEISAALGVLY